MKSEVLYCASCGRAKGNGPDEVATIMFLDIEWCGRCARQSPHHPSVVEQPSPGRMCSSPPNNPIDAYYDCFVMKPKKRILVADAKYEVQRAYSLWDGDKSKEIAKFLFFGWLRQHRPYFLTFRHRGSDRWQIVNCWLIQYEQGRGPFPIAAS